ncbi:MAG: inorganic diphosphatase [Calditrichaeota bacterium]|nr:inorganic diphosphatase [Calditrichota bacterium]MCB9369496.1 inorganic diphosphatase [Calditrichota bacterium]
MKLHELPPGRRIPNEIFVVIEVPYGHRNKYEYDSELGAIVLDRPLFSPVHYPGDYGFVPGTLADDGDPLDVLVMVKTPTFPGCVVAARPLGVLMMQDEKGGDEKILAVPSTDPSFETYHSLSDVPPHFLREMDHFFRVYKELEGKHVTSMGWKDRWEAEQTIKDCIKHANSKPVKKKTAAKKAVRKTSKRGSK